MVIFPGSVLAVLTLVVAGLLIYHLYLATKNQTTNERYKLHRLRSNWSNQTFTYNAGILNNLYEVLLPEKFLKSPIGGANRPDSPPQTADKVKPRRKASNSIATKNYIKNKKRR